MLIALMPGIQLRISSLRWISGDVLALAEAIDKNCNVGPALEINQLEINTFHTLLLATWISHHTTTDGRDSLPLRKGHLNVALCCELYSQNGPGFIKCRSQIWDIFWAHQPLAPYIHVVKCGQRVGVSGIRTAVRNY